MMIPIRSPPKKPLNVRVFNRYAIYKRTMIAMIISIVSDTNESNVSLCEGGIVSRKPIMNKMVTMGMEILSEPRLLVISAMVAPVAEKTAKKNKYILEWLNRN